MVAAAAIENNGNKNNSFIWVVTQARHKGIIPPDAFTDDTRPDVYEGPTQTPEEYGFDTALNLVNAHHDFESPKWYGQPYHVIVMREKLAQFSMLKHILKEWQVDIQIIRGHPSYTVMYETYDHLSSISIEEEFRMLKELQNRIGKKIIILYVGDWDPAGDIMDEEIVDYFDRFGERYGKLDYEFKRVAVLKEHETAFGVTLPSDPDARVYELDKRGLPKDKNASRFKLRYGVIKQIEVDALTSRQMLPHFKKLLWDAIAKYWFPEIWDKYKDKFTQEAAKREIDKRVRFTAFGMKEVAPYQKYNDAVARGDKQLEEEALQETAKVREARDKRKKQQLLSRVDLEQIGKILARELPNDEDAKLTRIIKEKKMELITMTDKEKLKEIKAQKSLCERAIRDKKTNVSATISYWQRWLDFYNKELSKLISRGVVGVGVGGYIIEGTKYDSDMMMKKQQQPPPQKNKKKQLQKQGVS